MWISSVSDWGDGGQLLEGLLAGAEDAAGVGVDTKNVVRG